MGIILDINSNSYVKNKTWHDGGIFKNKSPMRELLTPCEIRKWRWCFRWINPFILNNRRVNKSPNMSEILVEISGYFGVWVFFTWKRKKKKKSWHILDGASLDALALKILIHILFLGAYVSFLRGLQRSQIIFFMDLYDYMSIWLYMNCCLLSFYNFSFCMLTK